MVKNVSGNNESDEEMTNPRLSNAEQNTFFHLAE
jgi:hypothetical protein